MKNKIKNLHQRQMYRLRWKNLKDWQILCPILIRPPQINLVHVKKCRVTNLQQPKFGYISTLYLILQQTT